MNETKANRYNMKNTEKYKINRQTERYKEKIDSMIQRNRQKDNNKQNERYKKSRKIDKGNTQIAID